ncbi:MAG: PIN domain-containing protein [Treponema sp.]|nr:PIN domain-containing protein [Treponema sp.]
MFFRIFFDTAPLIYFLENSPVYYKRLRDFIFSSANQDSQFYTSAITDMEYLTFPYRNNEFDKVRKYFSAMRFLDFKKIDINSEIAEIAAKLRGKYDFLKAQDALQLASSIFYKCDAFLTNDKQLLQVAEVHSVLVDSLEELPD